MKKQKYLKPAQAGRFVGKLQFVGDSLYNKVGRAGLSIFRARQYQLKPPFHVTPELEAWMDWWEMIFTKLPVRKLPLQPRSQRPTLLYTDGAQHEHLGVISRTIGGVLFSPRLSHPVYFGAVLPDAVICKWLPKDQMINQVEAAAGVAAFETWSELLKGADVIHFVDSNTALSSLINGFSRKSDTSQLIHQYWTLACHVDALVYLDRVESKSNISDGPTKDRLENLIRLGAVEHPLIWGCLI